MGVGVSAHGKFGTSSERCLGMVLLGAGASASITVSGELKIRLFSTDSSTPTVLKSGAKAIKSIQAKVDAFLEHFAQGTEKITIRVGMMKKLAEDNVL